MRRARPSTCGAIGAITEHGRKVRRRQRSIRKPAASIARALSSSGVAAAGHAGPEQVGDLLEAGEARVLGAHMLVEAQFAVRAQHAPQLTERGGLIGDRAEDEGDDRGVDRGLLERQTLRGPV